MHAGVLFSQLWRLELMGAQPSTPLQEAASLGNVDELKILVAAGAEFTEASDGTTVIHFAARSGCLEAIRYLCEGPAPRTGSG